ncbi:hypothetical protein [Cellulomonas composti]|uniref:hypothetical protein n=1 Tax=Cellulomonas composti TaxID=266130 RepID=UPI0011BFD089|nr:hypothetical protein [Cellulomonas composti]
MLVGGLMVQLQARAAGIDEVRTTDDVDALVDVMGTGVTVLFVASRLRDLGFEVVEPGWDDASAHRLRRGTDVVDLLVADHLPKHKRPQLAGRAVLATEGGAQALARTQRVTVIDGDTHVELAVPDLLGALVLKAAAHAADSRDRGRHLRDAALLAALITDHLRELARLQGSDRKRLLRLRDALADPQQDAWLLLPEGLRQRGQDTIRILAE